jgi:hypothetical protein
MGTVLLVPSHGTTRTVPLVPSITGLRADKVSYSNDCYEHLHTPYFFLLACHTSQSFRLRLFF